MKNPIIAVLCTLLLISSCGVSNSVTSNNFLQKRKYTNGWHLSSAQTKFTSKDATVKEILTTDASMDSSIHFEKSNSNLIELRSVGQAECDTIILNDGKILRATILSTSDSTIRYTNCESDDPTEFTLDKKEIKALQYANGKFEFIPHKKASTPELSREMKKQNKEISRKEWWAKNKVWMIILMILVGLPLLIYLVLVIIVIAFNIV